MRKEYHPFLHTVSYTIGGSLMGIVSGLGLALLILLLLNMTRMFFGIASVAGVPPDLTLWLSMGLGAVLGGAVGAFFSFKQMKR